MSSTNTAGMNRPRWDLETSHPDIFEPVKAKLREVIDPEIGLDVVALGLIRNLSFNDEQGHMHMILTTPYCPYGPAMIEMTRRKAEEALGTPVEIELGMEMWDFSMMEEGAAPEWGMW
jgi:metal-sulfur cluster biosynthetic enzyme